MTGAATIHFHHRGGYFDAELAELREGNITARGQTVRRLAGQGESRSRTVTRTWPMAQVRVVRWSEDVLAEDE